MRLSSKSKPFTARSFFIYLSQRPSFFRFFFQLLTVYFSLVSLLCFSPWLQRHLIYLHWVKYPFLNVTEPSLFVDLQPLRTSTFYFHTSDNVRLGAWHICSDAPCQFSKSTKVFLYFHGNAGHRGTPHRIQIYKELLSIAPEAHLVTFDYRGYGDSDSYVPTNATMFLDSQAVWHHLIHLGVQPDHLHFVAHSLGTGIATQLASSLTTKPSSLLLFAPYTDIASAATSHPLVFAVPFLVKPFIVDHFDNYAIASLGIPIFIVHGSWDLTIPVRHSHALLDIACPSSHAVQFVVPQRGLLRTCQALAMVSFFEKWRTGHNLGLDGIEEIIKQWLQV